MSQSDAAADRFGVALLGNSSALRLYFLSDIDISNRETNLDPFGRLMFETGEV